MRFRSVAMILPALVLGATVVASAQRAGGAPPAAMTLTTDGWPDGGQIPVKYTQAGEQVSPALKWTNTPPNTVSFVLHMIGSLRDPTSSAG